MCIILHIRITLYMPYGTQRRRKFVWHVHVLPMFTFREQEELVNSVLLPNNIHLSAVPLVPDVPEVPIDVPDVPYVPLVPVSPQFVWQCQTIIQDPHL